MRTVLQLELAQVADFHKTVTGMPMPAKPTRLSPERKEFGAECLAEELQEFLDAETLEDEADALVDLIYFAHGRLLEMGIDPVDGFGVVHDANMRKTAGPTKRNGQWDAMKPAGWTPPDWRGFIEPASARKNKKVLLLGHGRHGKDTVAEMLERRYSLSFASSSLFCAEHVVMTLPHFYSTYASVQACFEDRHNHRAEWFRAIEAFNSPDKSRLGREIFAKHDIYCGLRSKREFAAIKNSGLYDVCIWVDRSDHVVPEDASSCTVEPWMADYILDNNGDLNDLAFNLDQLVAGIGGLRK